MRGTKVAPHLNLVSFSIDITEILLDCGDTLVCVVCEFESFGVLYIVVDENFPLSKFGIIIWFIPKVPPKKQILFWRFENSQLELKIRKSARSRFGGGGIVVLGDDYRTGGPT